jgi:hypothetical protein
MSKMSQVKQFRARNLSSLTENCGEKQSSFLQSDNTGIVKVCSHFLNYEFDAFETGDYKE